ncbi:uncharacterized protein LOC124712327 [Schistocerca piceifrons]|uniref:uncharacterized protein LOC124712327 n=1 Tax=Schistocerca piceifrons TaxID=274613 RepID=UPI001F5FA690|nr:uncharacterized protein LOC124712327 [Schistocerca piceifrons]
MAPRDAARGRAGEVSEGPRCRGGRSPRGGPPPPPPLFTFACAPVPSRRGAPGRLATATATPASRDEKTVAANIALHSRHSSRKEIRSMLISGIAPLFINESMVWSLVVHKVSWAAQRSHLVSSGDESPLHCRNWRNLW